MIKIFILGYTGMLGNYIYKYLKQFYYIKIYNSNDIDILHINFNTLENFFLKENIKTNDIIINCIGVIPQNIIYDKDECYKYYKINSIFPNWLSLLAMKYNLKIIHPSTDCVYNGKKGNYSESDKHDEQNDYGKSKSNGENSYITIIRTSIIGEELKNKNSLIEWIKKNKNREIEGWNNHIWNGITCLQFAKIVKEIIDKNLFWNGVRHIFTPNKISKYELILLINEIYKLNIKVNKINKNNIIDKSLITNYDNMIFDIPEIKQQIIEQKEFQYD